MKFVITVDDVIFALLLMVAILLIVVEIGISRLRKMGAEEESKEPMMDEYYHDHDEFYNIGAEHE